MSLTQPAPLDASTLAAMAEEVRAYVVATRGGAPFLSAADGRLLVGWLESGISVARILAAVDEVAEKRRKKRSRGRLTLSACKRSIEGKAAQTRPTAPTPNASLSGYIDALRGMEVSHALEDARGRLVRQIQGIDGSRGPEHLATEAVVAVRHFQEAAWAQAQGQLESLRKEADQELSALKGVLTPQAMASAIEEVCRDIVRRQTPLVSASTVWDRVTSS